MEIRAIDPESVEDFRRIISQSFGRGTPCTAEPDSLPARGRIGAYEGGRLKAVLRVLDFQMLFGEDRRPCGGIASVAVDPAARGCGYAGALLDRSLEMMRDSGQYLSSLWPFDFGYYRRHGWDWTGMLTQYSVPVGILPASPEARYVEPITQDVVAALNPLYEAQATRYNGALARDDSRWGRQTGPQGDRHPAFYRYVRDGRSEGYAIIRFGDDRDCTAEASELVALTGRAYRGLLALLHHHAMSAKTFRWSGPADDLLWSVLNHWDVETKRVPLGMSRVVDLKAALEAMHPDPSLQADAVIGVTDEHAPWNEGAWRVETESGVVRLERTADAPGIEVDIQALTQAYWGTPSLADLRRADRVTVHDESAFRAHCALLPPRIVWLADDF